MKDPHDFDAIDQRAIEHYVSTHWEAAQFACQLLTSAPHLRLRRQEATGIIELIKLRISRSNVVHSDVKPDFLQVLLGTGGLGDSRQSETSPPLCSREPLTAATLDRLHVEHAGGAAL